MKRHSKLGLGAVLLLTSVVAGAQMNSTPAPELKKLDYFTGTWTLEATIPAGPWGGGGKFSTSGDSEWMKGGFFLVDHADFSMPADLGGTGTGESIFGYDPDKKVYTEDRFDSLGRHAVVTGTLDGDTWTWTGENNYGGMTIKSRLTLKMISPTSYTSKYEVSADGGANWMTFWDGKATKK
ncbi:MAG TPA: DUF1579 family protein [Terriglobales bacterium]|nr:DUF1579 family protein [Terriglobales bacterium]